MGWAGGAERREGHQRLHTFKEMVHSSPCDPDNNALEAARPRRASETLLWDAVQGLRRPVHPRNPPPAAPDHQTPGMGHPARITARRTLPACHMQGKLIPNNLKFSEPKPAPKPQPQASSSGEHVQLFRMVYGCKKGLQAEHL